MDPTHTLTLSLARPAGQLPLTADQEKKLVDRLVNEAQEFGFEVTTRPAIEEVEE